MTTNGPTDLARAAVAYARAGKQVFPLLGKQPLPNCPRCREDHPSYQAHPGGRCPCPVTTCHGVLAASRDPELVAAWWRRWPRANIGCRVPRDRLVLDVDPRHGGHRRLRELEGAHGPLPATLVSLSGRGDGGKHLWFVHPGGQVSQVRLGTGLDTKTHAGYVVLPPSRHPQTGRPYTWQRPLLPVAAVPDWLARLLRPLPAATAAPADQRPGTGRDGAADSWSDRLRWRDVLAGWTCLDADPEGHGTRWRHPRATHRVSARVRRGRLYVFSTATALEATETSRPRPYTKLEALAVLRHGGDLHRAVHAAAHAGCGHSAAGPCAWPRPASRPPGRLAHPDRARLARGTRQRGGRPRRSVPGP